MRIKGIGIFFISFVVFLFSVEVSEFADDNASTTDENKVSEEIEDIEDVEGIDGVSSEGEKTSGGNETVEVNAVCAITIFSNISK